MAKHVFNLNVGVLGHVDSGKTSLVKVLSTTASTASFDKNPQSQERGITIDLGFSSFVVDMPEKLGRICACDRLQFTLVDCPGHASLIRTIIGGAQIIDMMILVIDVTKGMQTQTAECLVIGEITCNKMIVVLNKIDLLPKEKRETFIQKMKKKLQITLANSVFRDCPMVSVTARPGGEEAVEIKPEGINELKETMRSCAFLPERHISRPFLFAVDHCFSIRGQGTVMTGTVLQGTVSVNDTVEIPSICASKKVKSLQMFHQTVEQASQGDRLGICVTQFDPKLLERGLLCSPSYVTCVSAAIVSVKKIKYFKGSVQTRCRYHVSMGHDTVMAKVSVFGLMASDYPGGVPRHDDGCLEHGLIYKHLDQLLSEETVSDGQEEKVEMPVQQFALLEFERPVLVVPSCLVIGSKLDLDIHTTMCRLAFQGRLVEGISDKNYVKTVLPKLKVYKNKCKSGIVERAVNDREVIVKNMFKKETNIQLFVGLKVRLSTGEEGVVEGSFGQSGKVKIAIPGGLSESTLQKLSKEGRKKNKAAAHELKPVNVMLPFMRYIYDPTKMMIQL